MRDLLERLSRKSVVGIGSGQGHHVPKAGKKYVIRWAKTNDFIKDEYLEKGTTRDPSKALLVKKPPEDIGEEPNVYELDKRKNGYIDMADQVALYLADYDSEVERYSKTGRSARRR